MKNFHDNMSNSSNYDEQKDPRNIKPILISIETKIHQVKVVTMFLYKNPWPFSLMQTAKWIQNYFYLFTGNTDQRETSVQK